MQSPPFPRYEVVIYSRNIISSKNRVKFPCYRPGVALRASRDIALLFRYRGTRRGWVVSSTPRPHFTPGKTPVPILREAGLAPGPVWKDGKSRRHLDSILDRSTHSPVAIPTELPGPLIAGYFSYCLKYLLFLVQNKVQDLLWCSYTLVGYEQQGHIAYSELCVNPWK